MNKTKCKVCKKEITIPTEMDENWDKAEEVTNNFHEKLENKNVSITEEELALFFCPRIYDTNENAFTGKWGGLLSDGYYCEDCYNKEISELSEVVGEKHG